MKRLLVVLISLFVICYSLFAPLGFAQNFDFNRAYNDYLYIYNQYRLAHTEYVSAQQAYLRYQTLTSKTEALSKTLQMLKLRDKVIWTYLTALRTKLAETTGISDYEQNILYLKLDDEVNWYQKHHDALPSAGSLEDLVESAQESEEKYPKTEIFIYQTLGAILAGKETTLRNKINQQIEELKGKIAEIRQKGDKETSLLERWLLEAENRLTRSQEKQFTAQQILAQMKTYEQNKQQTYNKAQYALEEAHQYLKEAGFYLRELIREVKRAD